MKIELAFLVGLASSYFVSLMRLLPPFRSLAENGIKPFSCNVCMSFWMPLCVMSSLYVMDLADFDILATVASFGICMLLLNTSSRQQKLELPVGGKDGD